LPKTLRDVLTLSLRAYIIKYGEFVANLYPFPMKNVNQKKHNKLIKVVLYWFNNRRSIEYKDTNLYKPPLANRNRLNLEINTSWRYSILKSGWQILNKKEYCFTFKKDVEK